MKNYGIRQGYVANLSNLYYDDMVEEGITWQPDVYTYAIRYAKKHRIHNIIDIGSGNGDKLYEYKDQFNITFIDFGENLNLIRSKFQSSKKRHRYIEQNFEESFPKLDDKLLHEAVVICSDVIEHIRVMDRLTEALVGLSARSRLLLISTPERERTYGYDQNGPPANLCHVREWKLDELASYFREAGMVFKGGLTRSNDWENQRATIIILSGNDLQAPQSDYAKSGDAPTFHRPVIQCQEIKDRAKQTGIKIPQLNQTVVGYLNFFEDDYFIQHSLEAFHSKRQIVINHFKFLNDEAEVKFNVAGIENAGRTLVQYVKTTTINRARTDHYPIAINFLHTSSLVTNDKDSLPVMPLEYIKVHYLAEMLFGFDQIAVNSETLARLPNQKNLEQASAAREQLLIDKDRQIHELEDQLISARKELSSLYRNPAYYTTTVGRKVGQRIRKNWQKPQ